MVIDSRPKVGSVPRTLGEADQSGIDEIHCSHILEGSLKESCVALVDNAMKSHVEKGFVEVSVGSRQGC